VILGWCFGCYRSSQLHFNTRVSTLITVIPLKNLDLSKTKYEQYDHVRTPLMSNHRVIFISHKWLDGSDEEKAAIMGLVMNEIKDSSVMVWIDFLSIPNNHNIPVSEFIRGIPSFLKSGNVIGAIRCSYDLESYQGSAWCKLESVIIKRRCFTSSIHLLSDHTVKEFEETPTYLKRSSLTTQEDFIMLLGVIIREFKLMGYNRRDLKRYKSTCLRLNSINAV
jgi:hypothetical protein